MPGERGSQRTFIVYDHSSHAGTVRIGNLTEIIKLLKLFSFTESMVLHQGK